MDQDSFRKLLDSKSKATTSKTPIYGAPTGSKSKHKTVDASQPAFQPRKVKKDAKPGYRDRASERRGGQGNDYAQVEAVLEDFERRNADNADKDTVEQQRKYLGGDSDHSILVKGLDFALLEQNKARAALSTEDDDSLEAAFAESTIDVPGPTSQGDGSGGSKKRTRADILRELKEKQHAGAGANEAGSIGSAPVDEVKKLEEAKKTGKFKPIGFTPIGKADEKTKKKKKAEKEKEGKDGERKKKRRKVEEKSSEVTAQVKPDVTTEKDKTVEEVPAPSIPKLKEPIPEPDVEFDIFEGAGDYEIDLGDDEGDEEEEGSPSKPEDGEASPIRTGGWFADDDAQPSTSQRPKSPTPPPPPRQADELAEEGEMDADQPLRLEALESSALPSIKDFLAMDEAAGKEEKRRKRKEKKKADGGGGGGEGGSKMTAEAKADRDYQRLKSYQAKSS